MTISESHAKITSSKRKLCLQVTSCFFPVVGGQQEVVASICSALSTNHKTVVIQPLNLRLLQHLMFNAFRYRSFPPKILLPHEDTIILPIPTLYCFFYLILKSYFMITGNDISVACRRFSLQTYNWSLNLLFFFWRVKNASIIVHYCFHVRPFYRLAQGSRNKVFVFSHGIEWNLSLPARLDKNINNCFLSFYQNLASMKIDTIANDLEYIRKVKSVRLHNCNLVYLPNYVDLAFWDGPFSPDERLSAKVIILARNVREDRGILEAIQLMLLMENNEYRNWRMLIAGSFDRSSPYYNLCSQLSSQLTSNRVEFLGFVNKKILRSLFKVSTLSLVPSTRMEGTSLSALQSMACKLVTISTKVGGLADLPTLKAESITPLHLFHAVKSALQDYSNLQLLQSDAVNQYSLDNWKLRLLSALSA